jgi:hypothetical protein
LLIALVSRFVINDLLQGTLRARRRASIGTCVR